MRARRSMHRASARIVSFLALLSLIVFLFVPPQSVSAAEITESNEGVSLVGEGRTVIVSCYGGDLCIMHDAISDLDKPFVFRSEVCQPSTSRTLLGWSDLPFATEPEYLPGQEMAPGFLTGPKVFWAVWGPPVSPTVTITLDGNGADQFAPVQFMISDPEERLSLSDARFTRDGYTLLGWNTQKDGSGQAYAITDSIPYTADLTLYAQWQQNVPEKAEEKPSKERPSVPRQDTFQVTQPEEDHKPQTMKDHSAAFVAGASAVFVVVAGAFLPSIVTGGTKSSSLLKLLKGLIKH